MPKIQERLFEDTSEQAMNHLGGCDVGNCAAIDIGSNAIRLLIGKTNGNGRIKFLKKLRCPVRLGQDVFQSGAISKSTMDAALEAISDFKKNMRQYDVEASRAVATSAMREARNGSELQNLITKKLDVELKIIDYKEEARLIFLAVSQALDLKKNRAVLMDIGGGSVEYIISHGTDILHIESFPFGTVRTLLKDKKDEEGAGRRARLRSFASQKTEGTDVFIGTGGNIDCLGGLRHKVLHKRGEEFLNYDELAELIAILEKLGVEGRKKTLGLRPDRADVIIPAARLTLMSMEEFKQKKILIPHVGLKEGLLVDLIRSQKRKS